MGLFNNKVLEFVVKTGDFLLGGKYLKTLHQWNRYDKMSENELQEIQEKNLKNILNYAEHRVPYYIDYFKSLEKDSEISLKDFPVLTKDVLREQKENLVSNKYDISKLQKNFSSGSSGVQSYSYTEKDFKYYLQGINSHWYMWTDYKIGDPVMQFGISPNRIFPKNLKDLFYNVHYMNSFALNEEDMLNAFETMQKKKIEYIIGYPSAVNEFAKIIIKHNLSHQIKGIISLGDKLFSHFRNNYNKAFLYPKIIDTYGCAEGILIACSNDNDYYYIMSPNVYVEIVDDNGNEVSDGEIGNVLVTSLHNFAMPLIRYKLGDLAIKLPKEKYPENRKFQYPMLEKIVGRETDVVVTPTGKTLIVHSFTGIVEFYPEIKQYKIIQNVPEKIVFEYITDDNFRFTENVLTEIKNKIDLLTDNTLKIEFKNVDFIASSPSGKPQIIESALKLR